MEVKATAKFIRQAPRKVRLVANLIKGLSVAEARTQLQFVPKRAADLVRKVLNSALANAEHNQKLSRDRLYVARALVDAGPTLKRTRARAFGRSAVIRKRTSHITVVLSEKLEAVKDVKKDTRHKKQDTNKTQETSSKTN